MALLIKFDRLLVYACWTISSTESSNIPALQVGSRNSSMFPLGMFLAGRMLDRFGLTTLCHARRRKAHGRGFWFWR